jgi:hypothetical protein
LYEGFIFLAFPAIVVVGVFHNSNSNRVEVESYMILICISLIARDDEHIFMFLLAFWVSSFEKILFHLVAHFFIDSLIFGEFSFLSSLYILLISLLSDI